MQHDNQDSAHSLPSVIPAKSFHNMNAHGISNLDIAKSVCTVSRDLNNFELLANDMNAAIGDSWSDYNFSEVIDSFDTEALCKVKVIALAIDTQDEENLVQISKIISQAKENCIRIILIADDVSPAALHTLLRKGADEFVPYPLPQNELARAIERMQESPAQTLAKTEPKIQKRPSKNGVILAVHGVAGGTGSTMMATNLAWELATTSEAAVCILDLDLQYGSVGTYLDIARLEAVYEMLSDIGHLNEESFTQSLTCYQDRLHVLTAPTEMLPLDFISQQDVDRLLATARDLFDFVIVDMPSTLVQWSENVLAQAQVYFVTLDTDMRSAQNTLRFRRALQSEELPVEKLRFVVNRAPTFTDLAGKTRVKKMSETLGVAIGLQLPDGGKPAQQSADHGVPLAQYAKKNPLRREIAKLAATIIAQRAQITSKGMV